MIDHKKIDNIYKYLKTLTKESLSDGIIAGGSVGNLYAYGKTKLDLVSDIDVFLIEEIHPKEEWEKSFEDYGINTIDNGVISIYDTYDRVQYIQHKRATSVRELVSDFDLNCCMIGLQVKNGSIVDVYAAPEYETFLSEKIIRVVNPNRFSHKRRIWDKFQLLRKYGVAFCYE